MDVYILRDDDADGGQFAIWLPVPVMSEARVTVSEVRKAVIPDELWNGINTGDIKPHPRTHFDEFIVPHWDEGTVWWTRDDGYVNV